MKKLLTFALLSVSAFAATTNQKYVCQEYIYGTEKILPRTVVLEQVGPSEDIYDADEDSEEYGWESKTPYSVTIYENGIKAYPYDRTKGFVLEADVMFEYKSEDGKVGFSMYLDEMNESSLSIDGNKVNNFFCN